MICLGPVGPRRLQYLYISVATVAVVNVVVIAIVITNSTIINVTFGTVALGTVIGRHVIEIFGSTVIEMFGSTVIGVCERALSTSATGALVDVSHRALVNVVGVGKFDPDCAGQIRDRRLYGVGEVAGDGQATSSGKGHQAPGKNLGEQARHRSGEDHPSS